MITEAAQIDLCTPTTGPPGPAKSAHARHVGVIIWSNQPRNRLGFSQGARAKVGSRKRQVGLETTCVGAARA